MNPTSNQISIKGFPVKGAWISRNVFLPDTLQREWVAHPLSNKVLEFVGYFPDQLFTISSIWSSFTGQPRKQTTSHYRGQSIDAAPLYTQREGFKPDGTSANLCDNLRVGFFSLRIAKQVGVAAFLEDDHFHFDRNHPSGAYMYVARHPTYANTWSEDPRLRTIYEVCSNGELRLYDLPESSKQVFRPSSLFRDGGDNSSNFITIKTH